MTSPCPFEKAKRIKVAVWAAAYEFLNESFVSDAVFDRMCKEVDLSKDTDRPDLDKWFRKNFQPDTGMWVHKHPDLDRLLEICYNIKASYDSDRGVS